MNRSPSAGPRIPILTYHTITDRPSPGIASFAVGPLDLARHLNLIVSRQCTAITIEELIGMLSGTMPIPPRPVVLTFDDGYEDSLTVAAPLLRARGLPATVFVTTGLLPGCPGGSISRSPDRMLSWPHLADLEEAGIEVGSHSHTHPEMDVLSRTAAGHEIRHSKHLLEDALGHRVDSFAFPHGYATAWLQHEVRAAGFLSACGIRDAFCHPGDNRWLLSRLIVRATTTCEQIDALLGGTGAPVAAAHELARTKVWRVARRARSSFPPLRPCAPERIDRRATSDATPT